MEIHENESINALSNDFVEVIYNPYKKYLKFNWKSYVKQLTVSEAFEISKKVFNFIVKYKPKYFLQDISQISFAYTDEYINWVITEFSPYLSKLGVKKIAYVVPCEIITKVGIEILNKLAQEKSKEVKRLVEENLAKAELWLFEDESNDKKSFTDNNNNKT